MFNIGDQVEHKAYKGRYLGIVRACITFDRYSVEFFATDKTASFKKGYSFGVGSYTGEALVLIKQLSPEEIEKAKKEKVLAKIKLLDKRFAERQAQKAKEKENAAASIPVQSRVFVRQDIGRWVVYDENTQPMVIFPTP